MTAGTVVSAGVPELSGAWSGDSRHSCSVPELDSRHSCGVPELDSRHSCGVPELDSRHSCSVPELDSRHSCGVPELDSRHSCSVPELDSRHSCGVPELDSRHSCSVPELSGAWSRACTDNYPILREEVEAAVKSLKPGKSAGVDNIPAEPIQAGGETMIDTLLYICNKIWQTGEWPTSWTQSLVITLPKKSNLQQCQNYRTISLISHAGKVMLKILLNRLKPQAEMITAEE